VHVGQQFLSRAEMVIIGLHQHWLNGINYIGATKSARNEFSHLQLPIAVSIVMSGGYEDDVDNSDDLIYTGQGGNNLTGDRRQIKDQEMTKGNLALVHSMEFQTPVRVVRGHANKLSYTGKLYTYDGIYQVYDHWTEKGISGFRVFKYKLRRLPGQPDLTTQQVFFARGKLIDSAAELEGLVQNSTLIHNIGLPTLDMALIQQHFSSYIVGTLLHAKFCNS
jgi:euchromatic histone-lysine N-methyltransferase